MGKSEQSVNVNLVSRISAGTVFKGDIDSPYDLRIDGIFEGKIRSEGRVVIGENADVRGSIVCSNVDLWGRMKGHLYAKDTLSMKSGCDFDGGLHIKRLVVELGSVFNGTCSMLTDAEISATDGPFAATAADGAAGSAGLAGGASGLSSGTSGASGLSGGVAGASGSAGNSGGISRGGKNQK